MDKTKTLLTNIIERKLTPAGDWRKVVSLMNHKMTIVDWSSNGGCRKMAGVVRDLTKEEVR